jgi:hypothetical protein
VVEGDEEHVVIIRPNRPYHFCLHLQAEGRPFRTDWNDIVAHLFRFSTSMAMASSRRRKSRLPRARRAVRPRSAASPRTGRSAGLRRRREKLTLDRFRAHYRHAGGALQVSVTELVGGPELTDVLFNTLDRNRKRQLRRDELSAAAESLARLDGNSDELLSLAEVSLLSGRVSWCR